MLTKRIALLVVILALVAILFSQEKAATNPSTSGYQLLAAPVTVGPSGGQFSEQHRLFLVDSTSGNVWEYVAEWRDKENAYHPALLVPVQVKR